MKTLVSVFALLAAVGPATARADFLYTQTFAVNTAIPDSGELANVQTLALGGGTVSDISIGLNITSVSDTSPAYIGDYYAAVGHDDGYAVLLNRIGKTSNDLADPAAYGSAYADLNVTFADFAANGDIHAASPADVNNPGSLTGVWAPDARETDPSTVLDTDARTATLASFNGVSTDGDWRIFVADDSAGGTGTLASWTLNLTFSPLADTSVTIASNATATFTTSQTIANTFIVQGMIVGPTAPGQAITFTGPVSGAGSFRGNFIFDGSYSPGNSPASTIVDGDATFTAGNTLVIELGGNTPGSDYDTVSVIGQLTLGGTLEIVLINGFEPAPGDVFNIITAGTITGRFDTVIAPDGYTITGDAAAGDSFSLAFSSIPEPAACAAILGAVGLGLAAWRRRGRPA